MGAGFGGRQLQLGQVEGRSLGGSAALVEISRISRSKNTVLCAGGRDLQPGGVASAKAHNLQLCYLL